MITIEGDTYYQYLDMLRKYQGNSTSYQREIQQLILALAVYVQNKSTDAALKTPAV